MKIGWNLIDVDPKIPSGTLFFIRRWLVALSSHPGVHNHVCYATQDFLRSCEGEGCVGGLEWKVVPTFSRRALRLQREGYFLLRQMQIRRDIDVLISVHSAPFVYGGPSISILLDAVPQRCPDDQPVKGRLNRLLYERKSAGSLGWLAISEVTRRDCAAVRGLDADRIEVVYIPAHDERLPPPDFAFDPAVPGIRPPFAFYCTTLSPRKNHLRLLEAFRLAFPNREMQLVLAGSEGWRSEAIRDAVHRAEADGFVRYLRRVDDAVRSQLNERALFVVYPSLYEGYGMPVVEAWRHGKAVLTSAGTSMAEIGGDAVLLANPASVEDLATGLRRLYEDAPLREHLEAAGRTRIERFSPAHIAADLNAAITRLCASRAE